MTRSAATPGGTSRNQSGRSRTDQLCSATTPCKWPLVTTSQSYPSSKIPAATRESQPNVECNVGPASQTMAKRCNNRGMFLGYPQAWNIVPTLIDCWASVSGAGPAIYQRCVLCPPPPLTYPPPTHIYYRTLTSRPTNKPRWPNLIGIQHPYAVLDALATGHVGWALF